MASKLVVATMVVALVALLRTTAAQETHVVGDSLGWIVPPGGPIAYSTWAAMQTFTVGDILVFNFTTGEQDVARVTKEAFDACNSTNPISLYTTGPLNFTLGSAGEYYFIGTMDRHCFLGQKLAINVSGSSGPTPNPTAPPTSPRAPVTYTVGDSLGWIVPPGGPIAYSTWAARQTFVVGDVLVFNFTTGEQDVARVTKEEFDGCNSANPIWLETRGPANFTLSSPGEYYFIGTMGRHCFLGQKLAINVSGSSSGPTASPAPPPPPPRTPTPAPPRSPVTYVVGDELGWLVPPAGSIAYATWAYNKTFIVGDTLVFNFDNGTQDVAEVTKSAYEACDTNTTIRVLTTAPARIILSTPGEHFFTSTYPRHCSLGQRLAINVTGEAVPPSTIAVPPSGATAPSAHSPSAGGPVPPLPFSGSTRYHASGIVSLTLLSTLLLALVFN